MRLRDMKYIGFKHQRENKQNSDKSNYHIIQPDVYLIRLQQVNFFSTFESLAWKLVQL